MLKNNYEKLSLAERETFARVTNQLLAHSFLLSDEFDYKEGISRVNRDYIGSAGSTGIIYFWNGTMSCLPSIWNWRDSDL